MYGYYVNGIILDGIAGFCSLSCTSLYNVAGITSELKVDVKLGNFQNSTLKKYLHLENRSGP